jgi:hypothetical protein
VVESTYGDRQHAVVDFERFPDIINGAGASCWSAFAVGRTQRYSSCSGCVHQAIPDVKST